MEIKLEVYVGIINPRSDGEAITRVQAAIEKGIRDFVAIPDVHGEVFFVIDRLEFRDLTVRKNKV